MCQLFSPSAELYFFCFWFPIFVVGENWEPEASRFHAAAGEKDGLFKQPRTSGIYVMQMIERINSMPIRVYLRLTDV